MLSSPLKKSPYRFPESPRVARSPMKRQVSVPLFGKSPTHLSNRTPMSPKLNRVKRPGIPTKPYYQFTPNGSIKDDYYDSPIDWSKNNIVAYVADMIPHMIDTISKDEITTGVMTEVGTLKFSQDGNILALGKMDGTLCLYDIEESKITCSTEINEQQIGVIDYNNEYIICSNSESGFTIIDAKNLDHRIYYGDTHGYSVVAIRFNSENNKFIVTTDDQRVITYDLRFPESPASVFRGCTTAVRAVAWSPHDPHIVALGGGVADRSIHLVDTTNGETIRKVWTGSQICNLFWNSKYNEIVTTYGFETNGIGLWRASDLSLVSQLCSNTSRVLFAAMSPDESKIVTATPSDPIMMWNFFPMSSTGKGFYDIGVR